MPTIQVTSGDLITAALLNEILQRLATVEGKTGEGTTGQVTVPVVVGRTLQQAKAILTTPANQVALGGVLDTNGKLVDVNSPTNAVSIVIVQMPPANIKVAPATAVNLVVAAATTGQVKPKPAVTSVNLDPIPVNEILTIFGTNFEGTPTSNTVNIGGSDVTPQLSSNATKLLVQVPAFSGSPQSGGSNKPNVNLTVTTSGGTSDAFKITVAPPNPTKPTITDITPPTGVVKQPITINGTNFSATKADNTVTFDGISGTVLTATTTRLTVEVPTGIPGLPQNPNFSRPDVHVVVKVKNVQGDAQQDHAFDGA
jgi:hypothetical protein